MYIASTDLDPADAVHLRQWLADQAHTQALDTEAEEARVSAYMRFALRASGPVEEKPDESAYAYGCEAAAQNVLPPTVRARGELGEDDLAPGLGDIDSAPPLGAKNSKRTAAAHPA